MADETTGTTTGGTGSNVPSNQGTQPVPTPAPASAGAGVPASGFDVGLTPGAPLGNVAPKMPVPEEPVPDVGLAHPRTANLAEPTPLMRDELIVPASPTPIVSTPSAPAGRPQPFPNRDNAMQDDIQKILGSIKLPERRGPTADSPASEKQIPVAPIESHLEKPSQVGVEQAPEKPIAPPVHTLKDDIQHVVKVEKMSLVRAASLEEDRKIKDAAAAAPQPGAEQRATRTRTVLVVSGLLIVLGIAAILGVFVVMNQGGVLPVDGGPTSLIFAEQNLLLPIDNSTPESIKQQVSQLRTAQVGSLGSITRVVPTVSIVADDGTRTTRPATAQEFLHALDASAPEALFRSIGDGLFFGMHSADKNAPLIILTVTSYDNAFAAMLEWEHAINGDLAPMFTPLPIYRTGPDNIPHERVFTDAVIRNYDTRTLTDDSGTIQLYYSFPSSNLLIIAESPYTFGEVISRLRAQRRL